MVRYSDYSPYGGALITPPIGVNLYVIQGIRLRGGEFNDVAIGAIPFLIAMLGMILLLVAFQI